MDEFITTMDNEINDEMTEDGMKMKDNSGAISIEVILVLVVLVALVIIFKSQIISLANSIWSSINSGAKAIFS